MMQEENQFNWNCFLGSIEGCTSVDFSRCGIICIPDEILIKMVNIQYLYLEGNHLTELSTDFFPTLRELRWLDLRNNKLAAIPKSIIDHPSLQVLLLEGNNIENIPVEIGSVATLRGLQLARNPIKFPPLNIVNQGVKSTIEFLQKQWQQIQSPQQIHLISEAHTQTKAVSAQPKYGRRQKVGGCKSAVVLKSSCGVEGSDLRKALSGLSAANLSKCINVQPISRQRQQAADCRARDSDQVVFVDDIPVNNKKRSRSLSKKSSSVSLQHAQIMRNNSNEMQSKLVRDIWIEKVREMLLKQEAILQRRKNSEALQQWQDETKLLQQKQAKQGAPDAVLNFPYDTEPDYLKMLSRKDLREDWKPRDSLLHNVKHEEPINNTIVSIMAALQELQSSQSATSVSPRSEQRILSEEIKKIREIQRTLNALKLKNFGQLGYS